jgi:hypothetical protein
MMLNKETLQTALTAVFTVCISETLAPSKKYATQLDASDELLAKNEKAFSCFGMDLCWQQKAS